jgi:hypothetical protein
MALQGKGRQSAICATCMRSHKSRPTDIQAYLKEMSGRTDYLKFFQTAHDPGQFFFPNMSINASVHAYSVTKLNVLALSQTKICLLY